MINNFRLMPNPRHQWVLGAIYLKTCICKDCRKKIDKRKTIHEISKSIEFRELFFSPTHFEEFAMQNRANWSRWHWLQRYREIRVINRFFNF